MGQISEQQGQALVKLARHAILEKLGRPAPKAEAEALRPFLSAGCLQARGGTFVTLKTGDRLRGCIGSLAGTGPVTEGVRHNAIQAAFHDPRFPPLAAEELDQVDIEVSVLTEPQPLEYTNADDLLARLKVGEHGVIVRQGPLSATFLPQVWEQLPEPPQFLSHLCLKAGLPAAAWRTDKPEVLTYRVQRFREKGDSRSRRS